MLRHCLSFLISLLYLPLIAQQEPISTDTAEADLVIIDRAEKMTRIEGEQDTLILTGDVQLHQDSMLMYCDSARKEQNNLFAYGNVILQQWDSINVFSDTLEYLGDTKDAELRGSVILQSDDQKLSTSVLYYNTDTRIAIYDQGAVLTNDTTFLYSRTGTYYVALDEVYFKDSVYILSEQFRLYADTLKFHTEQQVATFLGPTRIDLENGSRIYCEGGYFDIGAEQALFTDNVQYVTEENQVAEGDSIFYDGKLDKVIIVGDASLEEPGQVAKADSIIYYEQTEVVDLIGNASFEDSIRTMHSAQMSYNLQSDRLTSSQRSSLDNPPQFLEADTIEFDNELGIGTAVGNIVWRDTSSNYTILCHRANYVDSSGFLKASGDRPLLINLVDGDSLYLSADTMVTYNHADSIDSIRIFHAYYDVRIFKENLQAICDSLTYSTQDSIFRLYDDPLIWSDTSQFEADTVQILLVDNNIDKIFLRKDAFIINSPDEILFNQMKGKEITASFTEGEIDRMLIEGNAASVYYVLDDYKAYIGVNETLCSKMQLKFGSNQVQDITFYDNPEATFHPIQSADSEALKLEGFHWRVKDRPMSVEDLTKPIRQ